MANTCIPRDIAAKLKKQFKAKEPLTKEELRRKISSLVKEKYNSELSFEQSSKIIDLHKKSKEAFKKLGGEEGIGDIKKVQEQIDYFNTEQELNKFLKELDPSSDLAVATGTIGRGAMLASVKSPIMNTIGNLSNTIMETTRRRLSNLGFNLPQQLANSSISKEYFQMASKIFKETGVDISRMTDIGDLGVGGQRVLGKDTISAIGKGPIKSLGRFVEKTVFKGMLGYMDNITASFNFADSALVKATKLSKGNAQLAKNIMEDAMKLKPKTELGKVVRAQAVLDANISAFTNRSSLSAAAEGARDVLNKLTGDARAGDWFMPFVKTPANVISTSIEYAGGGYLKGLYKLASGIKNGTLKDPALINEITSTITRAGMGTVSAIAIAGLFDKDSFVGAYDPKRAQIEQLRGSNYNAIKIGDKWISTEYFGPLAIPLTAAMYAKQGVGIEKINKYGQGVISSLVEVPGVDIIIGAAKNAIFAKDKSMEDIGKDTLRKTVDEISSRLVPGIVSDISKAIDPYQRDTGKTPLGGVKAKLPGLRETLPIKKDVMGDELKAESPISTILFGARVKTSRENDMIREINRVTTSQGKGSSFTNFEKTTGKEVTQFKEKIGEERFKEATKYYGSELKKELTKMFNNPKYQMLSDEDKLTVINKADDKAKESTFKKYRFKYKEEKSKKLPKF